MATAKKDPQLTLEVRRVFAAPRAQVFAAWADPEKVKLWMFRGLHSLSTVFHENDIRPGGHYLVETRDSKRNQVYWGHGTYLDVKPPEKISYAWSWALGSPGGPNFHPDSPDTIVTVEFFERGTSTEVVLTHAVFHSQKDFDEHNQGWGECLDALEEYLRTGR
ncbi:MAG TPA: SRPBCC domain-containing protein [Candidatus Saccharimonadales bacterium]|nr:SRPBCC domain-containing protein [Candidatus Saccharimonadales bacterium]